MPARSVQCLDSHGDVARLEIRREVDDGPVGPCVFECGDVADHAVRIGRIEAHQQRALDLRRVAPDLLAMPSQHLLLPRPLLDGVGHQVPMVGPTCGGAEGPLLAPSADEDRRWLLRALRLVPCLRECEVLAFEVDLLLGEQSHDHLYALVEDVHPLADRLAEADPIGVGLELVPAGSEPELESSARDDVHGGRHVRGHRRMSIRHGVDHRSDLESRRRLRQRGETRPTLEARAVGVAEDRIEVVEQPHTFYRLRLVGPLPGRQHAIPRRVLRVGLDIELQVDLSLRLADSLPWQTVGRLISR